MTTSAITSNASNNAKLKPKVDLKFALKAVCFLCIVVLFIFHGGLICLLSWLVKTGRTFAIGAAGGASKEKNIKASTKTIDDKLVRALTRHTSRYSKLVLRCIGLSILGKDNLRAAVQETSGKCLIVSNHLSYLDVLIYSSVVPARFVTSKEVEADVFLGNMAKLGGSFFVERRNRSTLDKDIQDLAGTLDSAYPVVLFPEGTSSNGEQVLPFKAGLLESAFKSNARVLPVCLAYEKANGSRLTREMADKVFYYGDMEFLSQLMGLLSLRSITVTLTPMEPFYNPAQDPGLETSRKKLADLSHMRIAGAYAGRRVEPSLNQL